MDTLLFATKVECDTKIPCPQGDEELVDTLFVEDQQDPRCYGP